jgi:hypothetical protein
VPPTVNRIYLAVHPDKPILALTLLHAICPSALGIYNFSVYMYISLHSYSVADGDGNRPWQHRHNDKQTGVTSVSWMRSQSIPSALDSATSPSSGATFSDRYTRDVEICEVDQAGYSRAEIPRLA